MSYLADILALLKTDWPENRAVNIVCHGHSVPAGYFETPVVDAMNAYPHLLRAGLAARFPHAVINVIVTAIGGETSEGGAARFEQEVLTHRPDVLTIDYGLNDRSIGLEKALTAWKRMIDRRPHGEPGRSERSAQPACGTNPVACPELSGWPGRQLRLHKSGGASRLPIGRSHVPGQSPQPPRA